jgi:hypothetical protein
VLVGQSKELAHGTGSDGAQGLDESFRISAEQFPAL